MKPKTNWMLVGMVVGMIVVAIVSLVFAILSICSCSRQRPLPPPITTQPTIPAKIMDVVKATPLAPLRRTTRLATSLEIIGPDTVAEGGTAQFRAVAHYSEVLVGDTDIDGDVDIADLGKLSANYGKTSGCGWPEGDFDGDGDVDLVDLGAMAGNYGR